MPSKKTLTSIIDGATIRHPEGVAVADPFCPISYDQSEVDGVKIPRFNLSLVDPDGQKHFVETHTAAYEPLENKVAMTLARQVIERTDAAFKPADILWDGARFTARFISERIVAEPVKGDIVALGLLVHNSYNASLTFGIRFFAERLACSNGMVLTQALGGFTLKHLNGKEELFAEAAEQILGAGARFPGVMSQLGQLASRPATLHSFTNWALALDGGTPKFPQGNLLDVLHDLDTGSATLWDQLNAFTYIASHKVAPFTGIDLSDRICRIALNEARTN